MAQEVRSRRNDNTNGALERSLRYLAYPVLMTGGVALHLLLLGWGLPLLTSTYVPVFLGMATITWLELRIPHERAWRAEPEDVKSDLLFMFIVQGLLPKALSFLVAVSLIAWLLLLEYALEPRWRVSTEIQYLKCTSWMLYS